MQSDHLYSICLIVQIFGGSSLRQFDHEKNDVFYYYTPKIRTYSGKDTEIWVPIDFLSTEPRE